MPSRTERAVDVTTASIPLAVVPAAATLLSLSKVARALAARGGGGATFPFPTGLPTLWTYVSLPNGPGGPGGAAAGGPLSVLAFLPLFLVGLLITSALEAGFLGALLGRIDDAPPAFVESVERFTVRMVGVNLVRTAVVLAALPFLVFPPLALAVVVVLSYLVYGLPFELVVSDAPLGAALASTVERALDGGAYASFGFAHLLAGSVASFFVTGLVRNTGVLGVVLGAAIVAVPAVFVATYGLLVFRGFDG
ncbi:hypothetical protein [Halomicrococcus gelatinilyticus]|uniref:hypothetical protein n=1 Tax=Halomicrococcus gelatinilyticus TaxID=1702103 RepID=UPI002E1305CF